MSVPWAVKYDLDGLEQVSNHLIWYPDGLLESMLPLKWDADGLLESMAPLKWDSKSQLQRWTPMKWDSKSELTRWHLMKWDSTMSKVPCIYTFENEKHVQLGFANPSRECQPFELGFEIPVQWVDTPEVGFEIPVHRFQHFKWDLRSHFKGVYPLNWDSKSQIKVSPHRTGIYILS